MKLTGTHSGAPDENLPDHPEGEQWPFIMMHGDQRTVADTASELLELVIDGYPSQGQESTQTFGQRFDHAVATAGHLQRYYLQAWMNDASDASVVTGSDERLSALYHPKYEQINPYWLPEGGWGDDLPVLVVVSTLYAPYRPGLLPTGDHVLVLDPYRELDYLRSLSTAGLFALYEAS